MKNSLTLLTLLVILNGCITNTSNESRKHSTIYDDNSYDTLAIYLGNQAVNNYKSINSNNYEQLLRTSLVLIDSLLRIDDSYPTGYYYKIRILSKLNLNDSALNICKEASIKYPNNPYVYFAKGIVQERMKDYEASIISFKKSYFLFQNSSLFSIQFDFEAKEFAYFFCYGRKRSLFRVDSIINNNKDVFYDKKFAKRIKQLNRELFIEKW
ncbi:MAG: hypothetical protein JEY97_09075 [Bacteroidales bacterium]|nr:hypothetical protein [Bacteroidales bacterium]